MERPGKMNKKQKQKQKKKKKKKKKKTERKLQTNWKKIRNKELKLKSNETDLEHM